MNGNTSPSNSRSTSEAFSGEYVELKMEIRDLSGVFKAEMARVLAKMESLEHYVRDIQRDLARVDNLTQANRAAIASLKTAASILGALAGTAMSFLTRILGTGNAG